MTIFAPGLVLTQLHVLHPPFTTNPSHGGRVPQLEKGQALSEQPTTIPGMSCTCVLATRGVIEVTGHVGFQFSTLDESRWLARDDSKFLLAIRIMVDGYLYGSQESENELRTQHYEDRDFSVAETVDAGDHLVELQAWAVLKDGHASARLAVKQRQYSRMQVKVYEVFRSPA